jgi:hypothetical protein
MVFPREQFLGAITELDENSTGTVTCHNATIKNVKGFQGTGQSSAPTPGSGMGVFWVENPGAGLATLPKFTDSLNGTITLGQNLVTSVFGRTGDVVGGSGDIANDSNVLSGAGSVTDALNALLSGSGGETLEETLALGNYTGNYDIAIDNSRKIVGRTDASSFEVTSKDNTGSTNSGNVTVRTGDYAALASGNLYLRSGANPTNASGSVIVQSGDNAGTTTGTATLTSGAGSGTTGNVYVKSGNATNISGGIDVVSGTASASTGSVSLKSGAGTASTGNATIGTGNATTLTGAVQISTGTAITSGPLSILTGNATSKSGTLTIGSGASATTTGNVIIRSGSDASTTSGSVVITTGTATNTSGDIQLRTGPGSSNIGHLYLYTGSGAGNVGNIEIKAGVNDNHTETSTGNDGGSIIMKTTGGNGGVTGNISITTGNGGGGQAGDISITTGNGSAMARGGHITMTTGLSGTGGQAGDFSLTTGNSAGGDAGDVTVTCGNSVSGSTGTPGSVAINAGDIAASSSYTGTGGNIFLVPGRNSRTGTLSTDLQLSGGVYLGDSAYPVKVNSYGGIILSNNYGANNGLDWMPSPDRYNTMIFKNANRQLCYWDDLYNIYTELTEREMFRPGYLP